MLFETPTIQGNEQDVLAEIEELRQGLSYALREPRRWTGRLRRASFARAIQGSNSIEGYVVGMDDALAVADGEEPLDANAETAAALRGYREAMTYVLQLADDPYFNYGAGLIRSLHYMMLSYNLDKSPGRWRGGPIFVEDEETRQIVYEGPAAERVPGLMSELVDCLRAEDGPALVRAAMAHLNLAMIHPFRDGNGRMARGLQTLVLTREGILSPEFCSIEEYLGKNTPAYYAVLGQVGGGLWHPENDARPWLRFAMTAHHRQAMTLLRRMREIERLWSALDDVREDRKLPERTMVALFDAAAGWRVTNSTYRSGVDIEDWTASQDLRRLVEAGLLEPRGEKRGRHYVGSRVLHDLYVATREPRSDLEDPFTRVA
jgi:Fic family protein